MCGHLKQPGISSEWPIELHDPAVIKFGSIYDRLFIKHKFIFWRVIFLYVFFILPLLPALPEGIHRRKQAALDGGDGDFAGFGVAGVDAVGDGAEFCRIANSGQGGHIESGAEMGVPHFGDAASAVYAGAGLELPDIQPGKTGQGPCVPHLPESIRFRQDNGGCQPAHAGN